MIEKNKKQKTAKKPEEPVPVLDNLESKTSKDSEGVETVNWFLLKNPQFRHLNLCLNMLDDTIVEDIELALKLTPDDFCFTLSGNPIAEELVAKMHMTIKQIHKQRVTDQRLSEPGV